MAYGKISRAGYRVRLSITISCEDPEGAMQFVTTSLIRRLRNYVSGGEENLDYSIDENGIFYLNEEQGVRVNDRKLKRRIFVHIPIFQGVKECCQMESMHFRRKINR